MKYGSRRARGRIGKERENICSFIFFLQDGRIVAITCKYSFILSNFVGLELLACLFMLNNGRFELLASVNATYSSKLSFFWYGTGGDY
jgi:hypothetical protein